MHLLFPKLSTCMLIMCMQGMLPTARLCNYLCSHITNSTTKCTPYGSVVRWLFLCSQLPLLLVMLKTCYVFIVVARMGCSSILLECPMEVNFTCELCTSFTSGNNFVEAYSLISLHSGVFACSFFCACDRWSKLIGFFSICSTWFAIVPLLFLDACLASHAATLLVALYIHTLDRARVYNYWGSPKVSLVRSL